jgi:ABC-type amino acid transport substrate-binding protein
LTTAVVLAVTVGGIRTYLGYSFQSRYSKEHLIVARRLLASPEEYTILDGSEPNPDPLQPGEDRMDRILRRGVIRIGFDPEELPFSYYNRDNQLVGFDIDMAHQLARDLGVHIEFVPMTTGLVAALRGDQFDVAMSGLEGTIKRATALPQMTSYLEVTRAVVVPDHERKYYQSLDKIAKRLTAEGGKVRVAFIRGGVASENLSADRRGLGLGSAAAAAEAQGLFEFMQRVELSNESEFFESEPPVADILVTSAEEGSAWTLRYPEYAVVRPKGLDAKTPLYYFVAEESRFEEFMNSWLNLKRLNGTVQQLYEYWILGSDPQARTPRWSIIRNVLHWVE